MVEVNKAKYLFPFIFVAYAVHPCQKQEPIVSFCFAFQTASLLDRSHTGPVLQGDL